MMVKVNEQHYVAADDNEEVKRVEQEQREVLHDDDAASHDHDDLSHLVLTKPVDTETKENVDVVKKTVTSDKRKIQEQDTNHTKKKAKLVPHVDANQIPIPAAKSFYDEEYTVEKIVDVRYRNRREFEVKWLGWPEENNTWETEDAFQDQTYIHNFLDDLYDDKVENLATQLARFCPKLPVVDQATLIEENRKAVEHWQLAQIEKNRKK